MWTVEANQASPGTLRAIRVSGQCVFTRISKEVAASVVAAGPRRAHQPHALALLRVVLIMVPAGLAHRLKSPTFLLVVFSTIWH